MSKRILEFLRKHIEDIRNLSLDERAIIFDDTIVGVLRALGIDATRVGYIPLSDFWIIYIQGNILPISTDCLLEWLEHRFGKNPKPKSKEERLRELWEKIRSIKVRKP